MMLREMVSRWLIRAAVRVRGFTKSNAASLQSENDKTLSALEASVRRLSDEIGHHHG